MIPVPIATKSLTFLASTEQKVCANAVGAGVALTVTATTVLALSHAPTG
ncbi:hypothetical protein FPK15_contig00021-0033 [Flavobacterium psychrophilum]|nr:hypothetical protein FPK15_contig00021-0033 [Flavobacterium psychrophilum]